MYPSYFLIIYIVVHNFSSPFPSPLVITICSLYLWVCFCSVIYIHLFFRLHVCVFVLLCLTYFTKHNTLQVHAHCCKWQNFIFLKWLCNIPFQEYSTYVYCIYSIPYIYIYIYTCIYPTSFLSIHLLSYFHISDIINNAAMNIGGMYHF